MDAALRSALVTPGRITNIWGKSGAGKTSLAFELALDEIRDGTGKVAYITDEPATIAARVERHATSQGGKIDASKHVSADLLLIRCSSFAKLGEIIQQLPFAFLPDKTTRESLAFKNFVGAGENDINGKVIESLAAYKPPSMVIIDEITRQYKRQSIDMEDPGPLNLKLLAYLGFLKKISIEKEIKIVITSATRTVASAIGSNEEARFIDVPIASDVLDRFVDIDAQLQWTRTVGERAIIITNASEKTKQFHHAIDMNALHNRLSGGILP